MKDISYEKFHKIMHAYKEMNDRLDLLDHIGIDLHNAFNECHILIEELLTYYFDEAEIDFIFDQYLPGKVTIEMMYKKFMEE